MLQSNRCLSTSFLQSPVVQRRSRINCTAEVDENHGSVKVVRSPLVLVEKVLRGQVDISGATIRLGILNLFARLSPMLVEYSVLRNHIQDSRLSCGDHLFGFESRIRVQDTLTRLPLYLTFVERCTAPPHTTNINRVVVVLLALQYIVYKHHGPSTSS
jgi:hypothetical protein